MGDLTLTTQKCIPSQLKNSFEKVVVPCEICKTPVETIRICLEDKVICEVCRKSEELNVAKKRLYDIKIPVGYRHMQFRNFEKNRSNETAFEYSRTFHCNNKGLYLVGSVGVGKTHLLISSATDLILHTSLGNQCKIVFFEELMDTKSRGVNKYDLIDNCVQYDYLFIDDVCAVGKKDEALDILFIIMNQRIRLHKRHIFMTSNISPENLGDLRITSRMFGLCNVVTVEGDDKRLDGYL